MELLFIGVGIVLLTGIFAAIQNRSKKNCPVQTIAKIVEVKKEQYYTKDKNNQTVISILYRPVYEFSINGVQNTISDLKSYKSSSWLKRVNQPIKLNYNDKNPNQIYVADVTLNLIMAVTICVGIIVSILGILMIAKVF